MNGMYLRFAILLTSMAVALVAFVVIDTFWAAVIVTIGFLLLGEIISQVVYNSFTDHEARQRELEDRVRNRPLG